MNPQPTPRNASQALGAGRRLLAAGLAAEAVARLREAPESAEQAFHLGAALLAAGQPKAAVAALLKATRERPQAPLAWLQIAVAEERLDRPARAAVALRHAVRLRPQWKIARLRLGAAMLRIGRPAAAAAQAQAVLRQDPGSSEARRLLAPAPPREVSPAMVPMAIVPAALPRRARARTGIVDHVLIVRALILRDLRLKYRDNSFGFVMELVRPVAVVVAHYYLFYVLHKPMPGKIPIEAFVIAGFSVWFAFNYAAQGALQGGRWPGGATLLPGVTRLHMRLARAGWAILINLVFCLTASWALTLYGDEVAAPFLPLTCLIFAISGGMGFGFGLSMERLGQVWPLVRPIEKLLTWALFVTSALYFCVATILPVLAEVLVYNPLLHLVEYERHAFDPGYPVDLVSLFYPGCVAALLLLTGLAATRSLRDRGAD